MRARLISFDLSEFVARIVLGMSVLHRGSAHGMGHGIVKISTTFVGSQVDICKAFGFAIPYGCAPVYVSKAMPVTRKKGRPASAKVKKQEL